MSDNDSSGILDENRLKLLVLDFFPLIIAGYNLS